MTHARLALGAWGERIAREFLREAGYTILGTDLRSTLGQVDLVAAEGGEIVFVEVKTRSGGGAGAASESVDARKRQRLVRLAQLHLGNDSERIGWRVDVVAVSGDGQGPPRSVELFRNVLDG